MTLSNRYFYLLNAAITLAGLTFLIWLLFFRQGSAEGSTAVTKLPAVNATLNATSTAILLAGYWAIKNRREALHKNLMISAFIVSALFLISYVYYHSLQGDTRFLGEGWIRPVYFFILISHIILSMIVFPMVLSTIYFGLSDKRTTHRKIARITLPIWLYVSVTGVVIFFMLRSNS
ncbi:MAG TPA: DUF420 domain-containing protein [bacterium]